MAQELGEPRSDLSDFAPRLHTIYIDKEKIRDIIGPGGKTIFETQAYEDHIVPGDVHGCKAPEQSEKPPRE